MGFVDFSVTSQWLTSDLAPRDLDSKNHPEFSAQSRSTSPSRLPEDPWKRYHQGK